ncbi:MAG: type II toxin-antitoxin system VapC family toxin [Xanthomonadales bacterium]|nr:type II toxin-antitoxin system VapC family toxin [Xanthomonadales bacterium]
MYLLDTNILIYFFKGAGNVASKILSVSPKEISISSITLLEIELGIAKSNSPEKRMKQLQDLCSVIEVIPFAEKESKASATLRATLENKGTPIGPYDNLIAGTALANNKILVSNNVKEFSRIEDLRMENWY